MAIFELRTYDIRPGKLLDINARFRDHTLRLFRRHGIDVVDFWEHEEGDAGQLIYVCRFDDEAQMRQAWASFRADPEWLAARAESEAHGPLTERVTSVVMRRTDYSPAT